MSVGCVARAGPGFGKGKTGMESGVLRRAANAYLKFADVVYKCVLFLSKVITIAMVASVSYAVVGRFLLPRTPRWCEEVGILCMVWICFLMASLAIRDGIHIRMTILEYVLPKKVSQALHFLSYVVLLALSAVWIVAGWEVVEMTRIPKMPSTQFPMAVLYGSVLASGVLGVIMSLARLLRGGW